MVFKKASEVGINDFLFVVADAEGYLEKINMPMWNSNVISENGLLMEHSIDNMYIGYMGYNPSATVIIKDNDNDFWGENSSSEGAVYLHKIAVSTAQKGKGGSRAILDFAIAKAFACGKTKLRIDTHTRRPKLLNVYESYGFDFIYSDVFWNGRYYASMYEFDAEKKVFKCSVCGTQNGITFGEIPKLNRNVFCVGLNSAEAISGKEINLKIIGIAKKLNDFSFTWVMSQREISDGKIEYAEIKAIENTGYKFIKRHRH